MIAIRNRKREKTAVTHSEKFITRICTLYGDAYDDRIEDSHPGGADWKPGEQEAHTSLAAFKKELAEGYGIELSTVKIRKILI